MTELKLALKIVAGIMALMLVYGLWEIRADAKDGGGIGD